MMTQGLVIQKGNGLAKSGAPIRELAARLEHAKQLRNERIARADAEYVAACERAVAAMRVPATEDEPSTADASVTTVQ
jgi:hypothetical protein